MSVWITTDAIHEIAKHFHGYGAPSTYDDQGANKFDWPYFERVSKMQSLSWEDAAVCVKRLGRYKNTQMPRVFSELGHTLPPWDDIVSHVNQQALTETPSVDRTHVHVKEIEETWYSKTDHSKRWPKTSIRVGVSWTRRSKDLWNELKVALPFPAMKYDGSIISFKQDKDVLNKAINVLRANGYTTTDLESYTSSLTSQTKTTVPQGYSVTVEKDGILLGIPRADATTRERVKTINGRKWMHEQKVWRIALSEAHTLIKKLGDNHQLSITMMANDTIMSQVKGKAERIAISSTSSLSDDEVVEDMRVRLAEMFPVGHELYPFQYAGVRFAELADGRALIGDDMGVGKTIQAIGYAALHQEYWPVLVVCPANVKYNWLKELRSWLPDVHTDVIKNGKDEVSDADFTVINYDLMSKKKDELLDKGYNLVIYDESHYLKNSKAKRTQASVALGKNATSVLCLSGTAMTNRPIELFTTLELVRPAEYEGQFFPFAKRYCGAEHNGWGWDFTGATNQGELHEKLRDIMIRRLKKEVMDELPDKIRQFIPVVPTPVEMREYKNAHRTWMREYSSGGKREAGFVLKMLTDLRHHAGRMKVGATMNWMADYYDANDKPLVVFHHHKDVGQALVEGLQQDKRFNGKRFATITGGVSAEKRQAHVDAFQAGKLDGIICSTIAAKEGLTLTRADTVVFIEREWVSGWEEQAEDRVNRIGQDSDTVWATYLSVSGTIDERFDRIVEEKRQVVSSILDGGEIGEERAGIAKALLEAMVEAGDIPASMLSAHIPKTHTGEEEE